MRRYILLVILLLLLLIPVCVWATDGVNTVEHPAEVNTVATPDKVNAVAGLAGSASPDVYNEQFTATDCDEGACPSVNVSNSSTIDFNNTTQKYGGAGQSMLLNINASADDCVTGTKTFTEQTGTHYLRFRFYVTSITTAWQYLNLIWFYDGGSIVIATSFRDDGSGLDLSIVESQSGTTLAEEGVTTGNWHTLVFKHPNDGSTSMSYKYDGGSETELTHATKPTRDTDGWLAGEATASSAGQIHLDDIGICQVAANCGW